MNSDLVKLKNIGAKSAAKLVDVGITSPAQLEELGAVEVFSRLREQHQVSMTMLWALQGALLDLPWYALPDDIKQALLEELASQPAPPEEQF